MRISNAWSWMDDVVPFVAMLMVTCLDMVVLTIVKAAMNDGMHGIVFVIYHNALGTLILLPFFILHIAREVDRPPVTLRILFRFFLLGLLGLLSRLLLAQNFVFSRMVSLFKMGLRRSLLLVYLPLLCNRLILYLFSVLTKPPQSREANIHTENLDQTYTPEAILTAISWSINWFGEIVVSRDMEGYAHKLRKREWRRIRSNYGLGLVTGICLCQILVYLGLGYSSPIMASAIWNLAPGVTFLIAVIFRMEKLDVRSSSSVAKLLGTVIAIGGAMVFIFYKGPSIFHISRSSYLPNQLLLPQSSKWVLGGLMLAIGGILGCTWGVLHTVTTREYPDQQAIVFFYCLFGTLQCIALSPFLEPNRSAWLLQPGNGVTAVVLGAVCSTVIHNNVLTWCLRKKGPVFVALFSPLSIVISVIMAVTFLGDSLHLGSAIGATIIVGGFYMVILGQTKEAKNKILVAMGDDLDVSYEPDPLLSIRNE